MKNFNFKRFTNVARWDLTTNSKFYIRIALLSIASIVSPVLINSLSDLFTAINMHKYGVPLDTLPPAQLTVLPGVIAGISGILSLVMMGYMFHNLVTRQGRISELTLPASNLERFVWHFVRIWIGTWILVLVGTALADLLHVILGWAILGRTSFHSIFYAIYVGSRGDLFELVPRYPVLFGLCIYMAGWAMATFVVLINAWKYRYNIVLAVFVFLGVNFALGFTSGLVGSWLGYEGFRALNHFLNGLPDILFPLLILSFLTLLVVGFVALTYRLYCRAQITTRRNP